MNIFKRLLKIGQAEIHALVDKMENPITLIEQGVEDMKEQLAQMTEAYVSVRAQCIRSENTVKSNQEEAQSYEEKALLLLEKAQRNELEQGKAESLALEALNLKRKLLDESIQFGLEAQSYNDKAKEINNKMDVLKFNITKWEKELSTLRAKQKLSSATAFANQQMANIDSNSTIELLQRMKSKIEHEGARSEAYDELAKSKINKDIDFALRQDGSTIEELEALKKRLNQESK